MRGISAALSLGLLRRRFRVEFLVSEIIEQEFVWVWVTDELGVIVEDKKVSHRPLRPSSNILMDT